jgi:hypothetical protein
MFLCWKGKTILETLIAYKGSTSSSLDRNKKGEATLNYWAGVICGICSASIFFLIMMFSVIEQNNELKKEIAELSVNVERHDEIMRTYEFFNKTWEMLYNEETNEE